MSCQLFFSRFSVNYLQTSRPVPWERLGTEPLELA
jgi:hypothetical protein